MKNYRIYIIIAISGLLTSCGLKKENEWKPLLDNELTEWQTYLSYALTDSFRFTAPLDEFQNPAPPIGYDKNERNVFSVYQENDEWILRISGEIYGCIFTKKDFQNYHLRLKVKFGTLKWTPRLEKAKDSGILYHSTGECGVDGWLSWMTSQEFQVMEGGTKEGNSGDYWSVAAARIQVRASIPEGETNYFYNPEADWVDLGAGREQGLCRAADYNSPKGEWTTMELICHEGKSLHIVNGHVVMALKNSRYWNGYESLPLIQGKIQLQSEAAEVFYKDIEIKQLDKMPEQYERFF
ncbi:MAG: DUF1080 domain-containing protein [Dysgonamonadaceae bacterium]|nr:DUF1080 domain-containing protein [Dysgonamonadaceae bacterium]